MGGYVFITSGEKLVVDVSPATSVSRSMTSRNPESGCLRGARLIHLRTVYKLQVRKIVLGVFRVELPFLCLPGVILVRFSIFATIGNIVKNEWGIRNGRGRYIA